MSRVHCTVQFVQKIKIERGKIEWNAVFLNMHCLLYGYTNANCMPILQVYMAAPLHTFRSLWMWSIWIFIPTKIFFSNEQINRQTDRQIDQADGRTDRQTERRQTDREMTDRQKDGQPDKWTDGPTERQTYGQTDLLIEGPTDARTYGQTYGGTDRQTDRLEDRYRFI